MSEQMNKNEVVFMSDLCQDEQGSAWRGVGGLTEKWNKMG